jgi:uracil-DNA glycosylase
MSDDLQRQLRQRLQSYRSAGIDWLPKTTEPPPKIEPIVGEAIEEVAPAIDDIERRTIELHQVAERVTKCQRCSELASTRTQTVFGVGPVGAEILFIGEAPGADEDRQGIPFVGAAGQLLNKIIEASGLNRDEIYICNILRCRPPGNRTPLPEECANCREYLEETIQLVGPKTIVCWGNVAAKNLLQTAVGISKLRGKFYEHRGIPVFCTYHPSALLHNPVLKKDVWEDMKVLIKYLGRSLPDSNVQKQ